jgi:hypothetical protein
VTDSAKRDGPACFTFHETNVIKQLPSLDSFAVWVEINQCLIAFFEQVFPKIHPARVAKATV